MPLISSFGRRWRGRRTLAEVLGSVVDLILIALIIMFALNGYRQGFLVGALSFVGFFGGALVGLQLAPLIVEHLDSPLAADHRVAARRVRARAAGPGDRGLGRHPAAARHHAANGPAGSTTSAASASR